MAFLVFLLPLSLLFLCISVYFIFIHYYNSFSLKKQGLPPGNLGFPIIGESLQLISAYKTENPEPFIDSRVNRFGKIFTTHVFGETTVFSTDYEVNRFILMNEGKLFECSYTSSISNLLGRKSLLLLKGNLHKKMHSLTKNFISNSTNVRDHLFSDINRIIQFNLDSWSNKVFLLDQTKKITFELIVKQLMSIDPTGVDQEWTESLRKHYLILIDGFFSVPILFLFTPYYNAIHARKMVAEEIRVKVRERKREKETMMTGSDDHDEDIRKEKKDMLGMLLDVMVGKRDQDHEGRNNSESGVDINDLAEREKKVEDELEDEEEIVDFLLSLILGGYETTSTIMTLAVKFLTETPLALAQLKEEHEQIKKAKKEEKDGQLEWSDYKYNMPFTQCVINETLRVANVVSGVFRRAMTDVSIKGYTIPKGCKVFTSFRAVHLNQDHFKEATSFNPWRWQQGDTDQVVGPSKMMLNLFTPFGGGPRLCPGYELARVEISVFLHHLVTTFSWAQAEEDKLVFFPTTRTLKRYPIYLQRLM